MFSYHCNCPDGYGDPILFPRDMEGQRSFSENVIKAESDGWKVLLGLVAESGSISERENSIRKGPEREGTLPLSRA